ncbi:MAG: peptidoglycan DD-metalloendopeptidase family protein [Candidatus Didemnitutus sp.]|nr:peptidoglycan DD-metalloendopeptidase family protein [Candidatus Didemnitutus sp.]
MPFSCFLFIQRACRAGLFARRAPAFVGALWLVALGGVTPTAFAAPLPPTALIAISGNNSLTLRWEASAGATSYTVQRRTSPTGTLTTVATNLTAPTYTQTGLTNGTIYYYVVTAIDGTGASAFSNQARGTPYAPVVPSNVVWPLANSSAADADVIRYAFGPRNIGRYDFHGGLDLNAPEGTPIYAVMAGTVTNKSTWDGVTSGSGNSLLVNHGGQKWAAYLHLNAFANDIGIGSEVKAGDLLGYVGKTGSTTNHLHFTYMVGLTSESVSESRSRSPLEILPHTTTTAATASFRNNGTGIVDLFIPAQQNTIRWIILKGDGLTRLVDYYDIVAQGSTDRDTQRQYGVLFNVAAPTLAYPAGGGTVQIWVAPDPASDFPPERVIVLDFNGNTLIDRVALPPSAPGNFSANATSTTAISLTWTASVGADSYTLERSPTGSGNWTSLASFPANSVTHNDTMLTPQTNYFYRLSAINTAGPSNYASAAAVTQSLYHAWKLSHGLSPALSDDSDDDGDGLTLFMEYALALDPTQASQVGAPVLTRSTGRLELTYRRARAELTYAVETSTELTAWTTNGVTQTHAVNGDFVTASVVLEETGKRFLRLVVPRTP